MATNPADVPNPADLGALAAAGDPPGAEPSGGDPPPSPEENTAWAFLQSPGAGDRMFLAGFVTLLFSIGGLVTVGIRRRRW